MPERSNAEKELEEKKELNVTPRILLPVISMNCRNASICGSGISPPAAGLRDWTAAGLTGKHEDVLAMQNIAT